MELVLAFAGIAGGVLFITHALSKSGTSYRDILAGNATLAKGGLRGVSSATTTAGAGTGVASGSGGAAATGQVTPSALQQIGASHGWGGAQIAAWMKVIDRESGGSPTAQNPTSSAYGIAQFINGPSEYAQYGGNVNTVDGQLAAMANYIKERYGTPEAAWAHELSAGWY